MLYQYKILTKIILCYFNVSMSIVVLNHDKYNIGHTLLDGIWTTPFPSMNKYNIYF